MGLFDTVTVDVLSAAFQTKQLGEGMLTYRLGFDEHVPRAVAHGLRLRGIDVLTVQDDDLRGIADSQLLDRATKLGRPLFSQDRDLVVEARRRQKEGIAFAGVIYAARVDASQQRPIYYMNPHGMTRTIVAHFPGFISPPEQSSVA